MKQAGLQQRKHYDLRCTMEKLTKHVEERATVNARRSSIGLHTILGQLSNAGGYSIIAKLRSPKFFTIPLQPA